MFGCNSDYCAKNFDKSIRFYTFPKNNVDLWVNACCRSDVFNVKSARICSKHFKQSDFERNLRHELLNYVPPKGPKLKADAVPSLCLPKSKSKLVNTKRDERQQKRNSHKLAIEILENR